MSNFVLHALGITKSFEDAGHDLHVLNGIDFSLQAGQSIAITGSSGCGKTTLLQILAGLDKPTSGSVEVGGDTLGHLNDNQLASLRNLKMGFIYQRHHLLPEFDAIENVAMPLFIRGVGRKEAKHEAIAILERVGLGQRQHHRPAELSGGERQRVAIARALVTKPLCVLGDEPTGSLDTHTAAEVHQLMFELQKSLGTAFVIVTHDTQFAQKMDVVYVMQDGKLALSDAD